MKCSYCNDPLYKFQEKVLIKDQDGKKIRYHRGCYDIYMEEGGKQLTTHDEVSV